MISTDMDNFRIVLQSRPGADGEPEEDNFRHEKCAYPSDIPSGSVALKTCYLSMEPALRCCMNEDPGVDYLRPWQLDETVIGVGMGVVVASNHPDYNSGDLLTSMLGWPWQLYFTVDLTKQDHNYKKVPTEAVGDHISLALSLPLVGCTALLGTDKMGHVVRGTNQTLVVSAAAGATGSLAGQIGKLRGCGSVIGICGTDEKCSWLTTEMGFDEAVNYKTQNVAERLNALCPNGIDIYFDNVGGEISDKVIAQMNANSHVVLCGQISQYNKDIPYPPPLPQETMEILSERNITRERFLVLRYKDEFSKSVEELYSWVACGKLKHRETIAEGLENCGFAFVSMMKGGNIGKQLVHVSDP